MRTVWTILGIGGFALTLSNCASSGGGGQSGTGPFDSRGNYVEAWADNPSKWKKTPGAPSPHVQRTDELPEIASIDQPPSNAVPIVSGGSSRPAPPISTTQITPKPKPTSSSSASTASKPKPKPKAVVKAKPKPKPKPASVKYVVKSGDSLSAIASRTGSSVSAIQRANGISGTLIRPGQSLTIPKKK